MGSITDKSLEDAWWQIDADHDGCITTNEYVEFLCSVGSLRAPVSPATSRRNSATFAIEQYPYQMVGQDRKYKATRSGRRKSASVASQSKSLEKAEIENRNQKKTNGSRHN